jgi:hypothetical protein
VDQPETSSKMLDSIRDLFTTPLSSEPLHGSEDVILKPIPFNIDAKPNRGASFNTPMAIKQERVRRNANPPVRYRDESEFLSVAFFCETIIEDESLNEAKILHVEEDTNAIHPKATSRHPTVPNMQNGWSQCSKKLMLIQISHGHLSQDLCSSH